MAVQNVWKTYYQIILRIYQTHGFFLLSGFSEIFIKYFTVHVLRNVFSSLVETKYTCVLPWVFQISAHSGTLTKQSNSFVILALLSIYFPPTLLIRHFREILYCFCCSIMVCLTTVEIFWFFKTTVIIKLKK